jgi:hypothetical protein
MSVPPSLLDVQEYAGSGYKPLIDYGAWRVAVLRWAEEMLPARIEAMQRHNETDEVFVLLSGRCILFLGEGQEGVGGIYAQDLEPLKLYNVRKACYHAHTLSPDASVLIVENRDTSALNSQKVALTPAQRQTIVELAGSLWPK